jgi:LPXTG-site transpeptidase (sortase) family protein
LIYLETLNNLVFAYKVTDIEVVAPSYVEILIGSDKKELLLTTCYPEYSARERMVIVSELINIYPFDFNIR